MKNIEIIIATAFTAIASLIVSSYIFYAYLNETNAISDLVLGAVIMLHAVAMFTLGLLEVFKNSKPKLEENREA